MLAKADEDLSPKEIKFQLDPRRGFIYEPNQLTSSIEGSPKLIYKINSQGFRDDELSPDKPLVIALGSSHTFGHAINAEDRWTNQLEDRLPGYDVYNMGVAGYSIESIIVNAEDFLKSKKYNVKALIFEMPPHLEHYTLMKSFLWLQPKPRFLMKEGGLVYQSPPSYFQEEVYWARKLLGFCNGCKDVAANIDKFLFRWPQNFYIHFLRAYSRYAYYQLWVEIFRYAIELGTDYQAKVIFVLRDDESYKLCQQIHDQCVSVKDIATRKHHVNAKMKHINRKGNRLKMERVYEKVKPFL